MQPGGRPVHLPDGRSVAELGEEVSVEEFEAFFSRHYRPLVRTLWGYCGDQSVAEESAQEAFVRTSRDWEKVKGMASPTGWLHRVAFNAVNAHFRRRRFERAALGRRWHLEPQRGEADVADAVAVRRAMRELPERQRAAVALFYFADLPIAEIARVMDTREGTVKSWLHRGRDALRAQLDPDETREREVLDGR